MLILLESGGFYLFIDFIRLIFRYSCIPENLHLLVLWGPVTVDPEFIPLVWDPDPDPTESHQSGHWKVGCHEMCVCVCSPSL